MKCNIDARGKAARLIWGVMLLLSAVVGGILLLADVMSGWGWWAAVFVAGGFGGFALFEARQGWCALRAMGIRTPL